MTIKGEKTGFAIVEIKKLENTEGEILWSSAYGWKGSIYSGIEKDKKKPHKAAFYNSVKQSDLSWLGRIGLFAFFSL